MTENTPHGSVTVIGSVNIDESIRVNQLPEAGETISARDTTTALGGKGANQAVAAARAGAVVRMAGAISAHNADFPQAALRAERIDTGMLAVLPDQPPGRAIVLVDNSAENLIVVIPGANGAVPDATVERACAALNNTDVVVLQNEIPPASSALAAQLARARGAQVIWNAAPAPVTREELLTDIDLLIVNERELAAIAAILDVGPSTTEEGVQAVAARIGADVICTLGADGSISLLKDVLRHHPAPSVTSVDTTAAGDTFVGYLAAALSRGATPQEQLDLATKASSMTVTRSGAASSIPRIRDIAL